MITRRELVKPKNAPRRCAVVDYVSERVKYLKTYATDKLITSYHLEMKRLDGHMTGRQIDGWIDTGTPM